MLSVKTITLNPAIDLHYRMESFVACRENYVQAVSYDAGGKGINISRALTSVGVVNTAYAVLGEENQTEFVKKLQADGVNLSPIFVDGRIRENITLHPTDQAETRISMDTFSLSPSVLFHLDTLLSDTTCGVLAFAGRLPKGISTADALSFLKGCAKRGDRVIVDCNSFTLEELKRLRPFLIKPNEEEAEAFLKRKVSDPTMAGEAARGLVLEGVAEEVMISLGKAGAVWSNGQRRVHLQPPPITPISTIGAGDSTLAGMIAALSSGKSIDEALKTAVAFGTAACLTEGTRPPRKEDIVQIYQKITLTEL